MPTLTEYTTAVDNIGTAFTAGILDSTAAKQAIILVQDRVGRDGAEYPVSDPVNFALLMQRIRNILIGIDPTEKPVSAMTFDEIAAELTGRKFDIPATKDGTLIIGDKRLAELWRVFVEMSPDDQLMLANPNEYNRRLFIWYRFLLDRLINKEYDVGNGVACIPRALGGNLPDVFHKLQRYYIRREELLRATTYHPDYGHEILDIIQSIYLTASSRDPGPSVAPEVSANYDPKMNYTILAKDGGRRNLQKWIDENPRFAGYTTEAKEMAYLVFVACPFLDKVLAERELACDQTRYHNTDSGLGNGKGEDPVFLQNPVAAWLYEAFRAKNDTNYLGWMMIYYRRLPNNRRFGPLVENPPGSGNYMRSIDAPIDVIDDIKAYEDCPYPIDAFSEKIDLPAFCEPASIDAMTMLLLGTLPGAGSVKSEKLWVPGVGVVDNTYVRKLGGRYVVAGIPVSNNPANLPTPGVDVGNITDYHTAEYAWAELIRYSLQDVPSSLTEENILETSQEDERGGLLYRWVKKAGIAKSFNAGYLKPYIEPMLTHYCYRLIAAFSGTVSQKKILINKMVDALTNDSGPNGTIYCYSAEARNVISNLDYVAHPYLLQPGWVNRDKQRKRYVERMWEKQKQSLPPRLILGRTLSRDVERQTFAQETNAFGTRPKPPIRRNGQLIHSDKKS